MTLASEVDLCLRSPSQYKWMKLFDIIVNYILLLITFLINFPIILSKTIGWQALEKLQNFLFSFRITIVVDILKCEGQCSKSIHILAISMNLLRHALSLTIILKYLQDNLSSLEVDKLLYFLTTLMNSFFKNEFHIMTSL